MPCDWHRSDLVASPLGEMIARLLVVYSVKTLFSTLILGYVFSDYVAFYGDCHCFGHIRSEL